MPLPERYAGQVPRMERIWQPEGYFRAQTRIWQAQCEARSELYGAPTTEQLDKIKTALHLTPSDIEKLNVAKGHETNTLLRMVQGRIDDPKAANFIHLGDTSSDVLDTSLALQIIESLDIEKEDFEALSESLRNLAIQHKDTIQIGRSHGQHGLPITFGRQVLGWYAEVKRGINRINRSKEVIAFGKASGEMGTNVGIEPELEEASLSKLGLVPDEAPTQVISRDRHAEVAVLMAVNAGTLGRIAQNIRLLAMTDVGEVQEPFDLKSQQGSSSMPHKKNPELSERVDGLNREIKAQALAELDNMLLWLERDISHSSSERFVFPDIFGSLSYATHLLTEVIDGLVVNSDRMLKNLNRTFGAIYSPRLMNVLLEKGMPRTKAYELARDLSNKAMTEETQLQNLATKDPEVTKMLNNEEIEGVFDPKFYLKNIDVAYKRAGISDSK